MAELVLGPLLRHVGERDATVWVETDEPCEVEVLGTAVTTFGVAGHHFALVDAGGLEPGTVNEYEVRLDGRRVWPPDEFEFPASRFRTYPNDGPVRVAFGSCRVAPPHREPYTLTKDEDDRGREIDALRTLALGLYDQPFDDWPDLIVHLGDQVYADEVPPGTEEFMKGRRDLSEEPGTLAHGFIEYTRLYHDSWSDPVVRWLLSTVSSAMVFDDHDVHDDWNISAEWVEEMRATGWWDEHIIGAIASYWVYQHIGNMSPADRADDELWAEVQAADDAWTVLRDFAFRADRSTDGARWSYCRELGDTRLVMIDSRCGRVLDRGARSMLDEEEWDWVAEKLSGDFDHLLVATSLPWLLAPGMHWLEAWNEAVCDGAWGGAAARLGERMRQGLDLEHWAAFRESFDRLARLLGETGAGERGAAPASIVTLSGDVHHAYLSEVAFPREAGVESAVYQAVCSPLRNPLDARERRAIRIARSRFSHALGRLLGRAAGVADPAVRWRDVGDGPWFDNQVAQLLIDGRHMDLAIDKAAPGADGPELERVFEHRLA